MTQLIPLNIIEGILNQFRIPYLRKLWVVIFLVINNKILTIEMF